MILLLLVLPLSASWWNDSWNDRKTIEITENSGRTLSNYPVRMTIDTATLVDSGSLQNDCSDLRFVDTDDSTSLDYWIKSGCNTDSTDLVVNVQDIGAGATENVYVYYDNPQASSKTSFSQTVPSGTLTSGGYTRDQFIGMKWAGGNVDCTLDANFDPATDRPHASSTLGSSNWDSGSFWKAIDTTNSGVYGGYSQYQVDFDTVWGSDQSSSEGFIGAYIWSPDTRTVDFSVGSDDTRKVWINGNLEHQECDDQGLTVDDSTFSATLDQGRNLVLMMVNEDTGGWGGQWRISSGSSGLRYSVDRAEPEPSITIGVPDVFDPGPQDGAENLSMPVDFSVNVSDPDGEQLNVSFKALGDCPSGWTRIDEVCYNESESTQSWTNGVDYCKAQGGHIVTINDAEENDAINQEFGGDLWIGYNDRASEGNFEWENGSSSYVNWGSNEPNNQNGEDCAEMYSGGKWNDYQCSNSAEQTVLCEKKPETYSLGSKTNVESDTRPEVNYADFETNETYYWYVEVTDGFSSIQSPYWEFSTVVSSLCDLRGPRNECILNSSKQISDKSFSIQEIFQAKQKADVGALSAPAQLNIFNKSAISGLWTGGFTITAEKVTIKEGAKFRPENDSIVINVT
ncbi:DUF2341 domain-containing protein [Candidatus Nanosalina sp. VS9-1]|uniref:C-type lectin domain-containing protein n=1 Tax=Candidatus Nanosalina sp. VS9-1 TaxID=3388566 RepID=UPI0039E01486